MRPLDDALIVQLNLPGAVHDEAAWSPDLVPVPLVNQYTQTNEAKVANLVAEMGKGDLSLGHADVLAASKWRYGRRPVVLLPLVERVLYRGVVALLSEDLPPIVRDSESHAKFARAPLETSADYIIITDLANFYSSIPTPALCRELLERTGRWHPVEWLREFWLSIAGGHSGIPQVSQPSDQVAEAYADELRCRLLRRGVDTWRYADDFRIAVKSLGSAFAALEVFDEEARAMGLFVNERKTYTVPRDRYAEILNENEARVSGILEAVREDLTSIDIYHFEQVDPEDAEVLREAARQMLDIWQSNQRAVDTREGGLQVTQEIEVAKLVRTAFGVLAAVGDRNALEACDAVLRSEPQLTPVVVKYLEAMAETASNDVIAVVRSIIHNTPLTRWQQVWIAHLLANDTLAPSVGNLEVMEWLERRCLDTSELLRSQAAWALASNFALGEDTWKSLSRQATRLGSPYLAAALNGVSGIPASSKEALASGNKLDRWVYEWASSIIIPF